MNIVEIDLNDRTSNFGGGIELLMNDKKSASSFSSDINIEDLTNLESELNDLVSDSTSTNFESNLFSPNITLGEDKNVSFGENIVLNEEPDVTENSNEKASPFSFSKIGRSSMETPEEPKTWDGFGKFNNAPIQPEKSVPDVPHLSKEDLLREKLKFLRKLEALEGKGVTLSKKYSMESPLLEMQGEYELIMDEKNRLNSVKFQGNMMMTIINGIEFLNNKFDPFDVKLDGWGEQIGENINDYDEIFAELHEKYKSKAKMAPELKLLFQLAGSGIMIHMTNSMFKTSVPGMDDLLRQNPELMKQFQTAAVNSMGATNPGFSGFMNGIINPSFDGPPPPLATQAPNAPPPPQRSYGRSMGSSINNMSSMNSGMSNAGLRTGMSNEMSNALGLDDGINVKESQYRPDMRGPSEMTDLFSGLKTKTVNIHNDSSNSTISIAELRDVENGSIPKRSKRKKSDKNIMSLNV